MALKSTNPKTTEAWLKLQSHFLETIRKSRSGGSCRANYAKNDLVVSYSDFASARGEISEGVGGLCAEESG